MGATASTQQSPERVEPAHPPHHRASIANVVAEYIQYDAAEKASEDEDAAGGRPLTRESLSAHVQSLASFPGRGQSRPVSRDDGDPRRRPSTLQADGTVRRAQTAATLLRPRSSAAMQQAPLPLAQSLSAPFVVSDDDDAEPAPSPLFGLGGGRGSEQSVASMAAYLASHGYSITEDAQIRSAAMMIARLSAANAQHTALFAAPDTRDALLAMAKHATTNDTIVWVANAIGNIASSPTDSGYGPGITCDGLSGVVDGDSAAQLPPRRLPSLAAVRTMPVGGLEAMRDALLHLARQSTNAHAALCVARTMAGMVARRGGHDDDTTTTVQGVFGTVGVRRAMVDLSSKETPTPSELARWVGRAVANVVQGHAANQQCFGTVVVRDSLLALVPAASSPESVEAVAAAIAAVAVPVGADHGEVGRGGGSRGGFPPTNVAALFATDDTRHALLVLSQCRPMTAPIAVDVSRTIAALSQCEAGATIMTHVDCLRTYLGLMKHTHDGATAEAVLQSLATLAAAWPPRLASVFAHPGLVAAVLAIAEPARADDGAINAWCCAVNNLCNADPIAKLFAVVPMRQAMVHLGKQVAASGSATLAHWWCAALVRLTVRADNKTILGSTSTRTTLCQIGVRAAVTPEAVMWVGYALYSLALDARNCRLFQHRQTSRAIVVMAYYATEPSAIEALCTAMARITSTDTACEDSTAATSATALNVDVDELGHIDSVTVNESTETLFATDDMRDAFVAMAQSRSGMARSEAAEAWCAALCNICNNETSRFLFGCPAMRDAIHAVGRCTTSAAAAANWCQLIALLAVSGENRPLFHTSAFRHAFFTIRLHCTTDDAVLSFCKALAGIAQDTENRHFYCTSKCYEALVVLSNAVASTESARRWCSAVRVLAMDDKNKTRLGDAAIRDGFIRVSMLITRAEGVHEWGAAVKLLCIKANTKHLFADKGVLDAIALLSKHSWSSDAVRSLCGAVNHIAMDDRGRQLLRGHTALQHAIPLLDSHANTSALARDAYHTAVRTLLLGGPDAANDGTQAAQVQQQHPNAYAYAT